MMNPSGKSQAQLRSGEHQSSLCSSSSSSWSCGMARSRSSSTWRGGLRMLPRCYVAVSAASAAAKVLAATWLLQAMRRTPEDWRRNRFGLKPNH